MSLSSAFKKTFGSGGLSAAIKGGAAIQLGQPGYLFSGNFKKDVGNNTVKDFLSLDGQTAIQLGQPGYFYEESKKRKSDRAEAEARAVEGQRVQASNDAADAVNQTIIDAKRKRRNTALLAPAAGGTPLGGAQTALGRVGG